MTNPQDVYKIINYHYQEQFFDETEETLEQFVGNPRKLNNEITLEEVKKSMQECIKSKNIMISTIIEYCI